MNKVHKTIYNEQTGTFVAVAEDVKARGKKSSTTRSMRSVVAAVAATLVASSAAFAEVNIDDTNNKIEFSGAPGQIVNVGSITGLAGLTVTGEISASQLVVDTEVGLAQNSKNVATVGQLHTTQTALDSAEANIATIQTDVSTIQTNLGTLESQVTTNTDTITQHTGRLDNLDTKVDNNKTAISGLDSRMSGAENRLATAETNINNIDARVVANKDAVDAIFENLGVHDNTIGAGVKYFRTNSSKADSNAVGSDSVAIGPAAQSGGSSSIAMGDGASTGEEAGDSVAIGTGSQVEGSKSIALGDGAEIAQKNTTGAQAIGSGAKVENISDNALAVGTAALSGATSAAALGHSAQATGSSATAIGASAKASGSNAVALGQATGSGTSSIAIGQGAVAPTANSIMLGTGAGVGTVSDPGGNRHSQIAIGKGAGTGVQGNETIAIGVGAGAGAKKSQNIAIGTSAGTNLDGEYNVSIGYEANKNLGEQHQSTAIGGSSHAEENAVAVGYKSKATQDGIAIGSDSEAENQAIAIGKGAKAKTKHIALGHNAAAVDDDAKGPGYLTGSDFANGAVLSVGSTEANTQRRIVNVADGANRYDAVNVGQLQLSQEKVANIIGGGVTVNDSGTFGKITIVDNQNQAHEFDTVVEAMGAISSGQITSLPAEAVTYIGDKQIQVNAATQGDQAVNLKQMNTAISEKSSRYFSIDKNSDTQNSGNDGADGANSMAVGPASNAQGLAALALGYKADAEGDATVAIGKQVKADAEHATVLGSQSNVHNKGGVAIGYDTISHGDNSLAMGTDAKTAPKSGAGATVDNAIAFGTSAWSTADDAIAIGHNSRAAGIKSVAHGYDAQALNESAMAFGTSSRAIADNSQASGTRAEASASNAIATGTDASASGNDAQASGTRAKAWATDGIAIGTDAKGGFVPDPNDPAKNTRNIKSIAIGDSATAQFEQALAVGSAAKAIEEDAMAIGTGATANQARAMAQGQGAQATAEQAIAQGSSAIASGENAVALGTEASASATGAIAQGVKALANQTGALATGSQAQAQGINAAAYGAGARALNNRSVAFGADAQASHDNSIALGAGAQTAAAVGTSSATINTLTYGGFAGDSPIGTVSVGKVGEERTITNVAAGRISATSTDAINGSQLFATQQVIGNIAKSTKDILGGNASVGNDGSLTTNNIGGTGETTIHDAIGYAAQGWKLAADGTAGAETIKPGETATFAAGRNMEVSRSGSTITYGTANDVSFNRLNVGGNNFIVDGNSFTVGNNTTINMGNNRITQVAPGTDGTDAVNLDQLNQKGDELIAQGLNFAANAGNDVHRNLGQTLDIKGLATTVGGYSAANIKTETTNNGINILMAETPHFSGADMGGGKITNVADGTNDSDAVNWGQIKNIQLNADSWTATDVDGNDARIGPAGKVTFEGDENITVSQTGQNLAGVIEVALKKQLDLGPDGSLTIGDSHLDTDGLVVDDGAGNTKKTTATGTSVTDGTKTTTTTAAGTTVIDGDKTTTVAAGVINVGSNTNTIIIDGDQGTIGGLTNKTFDPDNFTSGQAATEDQLKGVSDVANAGWNLSATGAGSSTVNIGPDGDVKFDGDNNITVSQTGQDDEGVIEIALNKDVDLGNDGSLTIGDSHFDTDGLVVDDGAGNTTKTTATGTSVTDGTKTTTTTAAGTTVIDGDKTTTVAAGVINVGSNTNTIIIDGDQGTIGGLTNKTFDPDNFTSGQAATEDQLKGVSDVANAGWNLSATGAGSSTVNIGPDGDVKFDGDNNITVSQTGQKDDGVIEIALNKDLKDLETIVVGENTQPGKDGAAGDPGIGLDGKDGTIGITGKDGSGVAGAPGLDGMDGSSADITVKQGTAGLDGNDGADGKTKTRIVYEKPDGEVEEVATLNDGLVFQGDQIGDAGKVERQLNETLQLQGGVTDPNKLVDEANIGIVKNAGGDGYYVQLAKDITGLSTIQVGGNTGPVIGGQGDNVVLNPGAAATKITNVAKGDITANSTDAINGSQLHAVGDSIVDFLGGDAKLNTDGTINFGDYFDGIFGSGSGINSLRDALEPWTVGAGGGNSEPVLPGDNVDFSGEDQAGAGGGVPGAGGDGNIVVDIEHDGKDHDVTFELADNVHINESLAVGDSDGAYIALGDDGKRGSAGSLTFYGEPDAAGDRISATQTVVNGPGGVGTEQSQNDSTRLSYSDADGSNYTVATLDDGLSFGANDGATHHAPLNTQVNVVGHENNTDWADFDAGQNIMTQVGVDANGAGQITVALAQDLEVKSVSAETVTADTVEINNGPIINENGIDMRDKSITNLAAGTNRNDAVNVGQLRDAENRLDGRIDNLRNDMHRMDKRNRAGIAAAMATAGLPQAYLPGKSMMAMAGATWRGESGMAIGVSTISDSGHWVVKLSGTTSSRGDFGGTVGVGYQW